MTKQFPFCIMALFFVVIPCFLHAQGIEEIPFNERPDIGIKEVKVERVASSPSNHLLISATIFNASDAVAGPFKVSIVANGQLIKTQEITIRARSGRIEKFKWSAAAKGENHVRVIADADYQLNETERSDNIKELQINNSSKGVQLIQKKEPVALLSNKTDLSNVTATAGAVHHWTSVGPDLIKRPNSAGELVVTSTGRLSAIAIHPTATQIMYVGGQKSGIWKTTDGGLGWVPLTDQISVSVAAIALSPANPNQVYWVTAREGVFRSDDAGSSWTQISAQDLDAVVHGGKLLILPENPNIMLVKSNAGIYRSENGGINWTLVRTNGQGTGLEIFNETGTILYCAMYSTDNNDVAGIYRSHDKGITWVKVAGCPGGRLPAVNAGKKITIAISGSTIFAGFKSSTEFQLYRAGNLRCTPSLQELSWESAWHTTTVHQELWSELWANPLNENYLYLGGTKFWRSTDKGSNFSISGSGGSNGLGGTHADHHAFAMLPGDENTIFSLNDGGIYRSALNGKPTSWEFLGKGIANAEFYDLADAYTTNDLLIGGTQDNGVIKTNGSLEWQEIRGGDGSTVDIDNTNAELFYSLGQYANSIKRSVNGGRSWLDMSSGLPAGSPCFNMRYHLHPERMNILLAACVSLWRITDPSGSWETIFTPSEGIVTCSSVEASTDTYLAGTSTGKVFAGPAGNNFQEVFSHPSLSHITDIECSTDNASIIFLGCAGTAAGRVYMLTKTSSNTYSAADITNNLPTELHVQCIAVDKMNLFTIYAGTNRGVYRGKSFNQGATWHWSSYMAGLPKADVRDLEIHPVSGILTAATHGRSIFEVFTDDPIGSTLYIEGKINFLRIHDAGTGFGPPNDVLDAEVIVQVDTKPGHYFGLQLRPDTKEVSNTSSLELLRTAFESNLPVRIEYVRTGLHSGRIIRTHLQ